MEYSGVFDIVRFEKAKVIARFNMFRRIAKSRQILEGVVLLGLISWSTVRLPEAAKTAARLAFRFSTYLFNHHFVFLIGNAIIVWLFVMCRRNEEAANSAASVADDLYDDYVRHSEASSRVEIAPPQMSPMPDTSSGISAEGGGGDEEKQIVVCAEETAAVVSQCDDAAVAIEMAKRQIRRFKRTQSERLRREIGMRPRAEFRQSESENRRKSASSVDEIRAANIERLSNEEFRQTVDAFIYKHWGKKTTK